MKTMEASQIPDRPRTPEGPRTVEQWYPEPIFAGPKTDQIERNVVIMVFAAFLAGLMLGKIMNPVILKH